MIHFTAAVRIKPDYPDAHNNLGAAFEALGRPDDAAAHYREALRLHPGSRQARENPGKVGGR